MYFGEPCDYSVGGKGHYSYSKTAGVDQEVTKNCHRMPYIITVMVRHCSGMNYSSHRVDVEKKTQWVLVKWNLQRLLVYVFLACHQSHKIPVNCLEREFCAVNLHEGTIGLKKKKKAYALFQMERRKKKTA